MAQKSLGYTKLEWVCPNCGTRNPGPNKTCSGCGFAQPKDVQFQQAVREEILEDGAEIQKAKAGADIHCAYCGARNLAGTNTCINCGADLKEGTKRQSGTVVGSHRSGKAAEVVCLNCGAKNPDTAVICSQCGGGLIQKSKPVASVKEPGKKKKLSPFFIALSVLGGLTACGLLIFFLISLFGKQETLIGVVQQTDWQRSVVIEQYGPITSEDWLVDIPAGAQIGDCELRYNTTSDQPEPNSTEVCGTPYTVDKGSGYGEVVQDCTYEVYAEFCEYTIDDWFQVDTVSIQGSDQSPSWPQPSLSQGQRQGDQTELYTIVFDTDEGVYEYTTSDYALYQQAAIGSDWELSINAFNKVIDIKAR